MIDRGFGATAGHACGAGMQIMLQRWTATTCVHAGAGTRLYPSPLQELLVSIVQSCRCTHPCSMVQEVPLCSGLGVAKRTHACALRLFWLS